MVDRLSFDVRAEDEARAALERRYFAGHDMFFPDARQAWSEYVDLVERVVRLADVFAPEGKLQSRQRGSAGNEPTASIEVRVAERAARLADDARVRAFELLGDRPRAIAIMERRLLASAR